MQWPPEMYHHWLCTTYKRTSIMTSQVFVSHSHDDAAVYSSLCLALDASEVSRWDVSQMSLGKPLAEALRSAIEQCDTCVFLATTRSLESRWCLAELGAFWGAGKKVVMYLVDPNIHETDLPPQFRNNLWTRDALRLVEAIKETDSGPIRRTTNGYCVSLGTMTINVTLGRIEQSDCSEKDWTSQTFVDTFES